MAVGPPGESGGQRRRSRDLRTGRRGGPARRRGGARGRECAGAGRPGFRARRGEPVRRVLGWRGHDGLGRDRRDPRAGGRRHRRPPAGVAVACRSRPHPLPGARLARNRAMGRALLRGARHVPDLHRRAVPVQSRICGRFARGGGGSISRSSTTGSLVSFASCHPRPRRSRPGRAFVPRRTIATRWLPSCWSARWLWSQACNWRFRSTTWVAT